MIDDYKRREAMYEHLNVAYNHYKKGNSGQLTAIVEQISKPTKTSIQISMWVEQFNKLIIQLHKTHQDPKMIIDIVLYQMPWFSSENHLNAFHSFKQFIMTVLSEKPQFTQQIYCILVSKLNIDQNIQDPTQQQLQDLITVNGIYNILNYKNKGIQFQSRNTLVEEIQKILRQVDSLREDEIQHLVPIDNEFILAVLRNHPNAKIKLENCKQIGIGYFPSRNPTKCFYVIRNVMRMQIYLYQLKDNTVEDISYIKSVDNLYECIIRNKLIAQIGNQSLRYENIISLIAEINKIQKIYQNKLIEFLSESFPHKSRHEFFLKTYIINLLQLSDVVPEIRPRVIKLIVIRLMSLDSEIKDNANSHQRSILHKYYEHKDEMSKKLDNLLFIILEYFNIQFDQEMQCIHFERAKQKQLDSDQVEAIFLELQKVFIEVILRNQQCKMIHFLFILLCSQEKFERLQQLYVSRLILYMQEDKENVPKQSRINAIFYLTSFLIRCKKIQLPVLQKSIEYILEYGRTLLKQANTSSLKKAQTIKENEILLQILQSLAFLVGNKLIVQQNVQLVSLICSLLIEAQKKLQALTYLQNEILGRLNDILLKLKSNKINEKVLEITSDILGKQYDKGTESPSSIVQSPTFFAGTPMCTDYESHQTRYSAWSIKRLNNNNQLEFTLPFNNLTLINSEPLLQKYYISDVELSRECLHDTSSPHNKKKIRDVSQESIQIERIEKKIKPNNNISRKF